MKILIAKGFTLIELLIVVAIIAILAAIAVPNFLEAQTRARVARVKTDMRTLALAMESYLVDQNTPPLAEDCLYTFFGINAWQTPMWYERRLTTPVQYLTKTPKNPFADKNFWLDDTGTKSWPGLQGRYLYSEYGYYATHHLYIGKYTDGTDNYSDDPNKSALWRMYNKANLRWSFASSGPRQQGSKEFVTERQNKIWAEVPGRITFPSYEPTNGTMSYGYILRTNKGDYTIEDKW